MSEFRTFVVADGERLEIGDVVCINDDGKVAKAYPNPPFLLGTLPPGTKFRGKYIEVPER